MFLYFLFEKVGFLKSAISPQSNVHPKDNSDFLRSFLNYQMLHVLHQAKFIFIETFSCISFCIKLQLTILPYSEFTLLYSNFLKPDPLLQFK